MTYEEATIYLNNHGYLRNDNEEDCESMRKAIEALEKQIAKRPLDADITNERGYGKCPTCLEVVNTFDNYTFCDCGQKILWE